MNPETRNQAERSAPDEIFLTPRVVDRRAFEAFASMLRESVERATRESDLLARRAEAAASVLERLEGFVGAHTDIFQRAAALIDTIDQRQRSAGDTLETLTRRTELAQQTARDVESLVRERGEAFEARLATLASGTLDSFEAARQSLSGDASKMRRDLSQRLDELRQRGETLLTALAERTEQAGQELTEQLSQLEAARETLRSEQRESGRRLDEHGDALREGLRTESAALKRELDAAARALREAVAASAAHRDTIERAAELAVARVQAGAGEQTLELERLARRSEGLLRDHRQSVESLATEVEARLESARERSLMETSQLELRSRAQVEKLSGELGLRLQQTQDAASVLDTLVGAIETAGRWTSAIEGQSGVLDAKLALMVDLGIEARACESERVSKRLGDELAKSEARRQELEEEVARQGARLGTLEASLATLIATQEAAVAKTPSPHPLPAADRVGQGIEPLVPVVVTSKPARKAPARKPATKTQSKAVIAPEIAPTTPAKPRARKRASATTPVAG